MNKILPLFLVLFCFKSIAQNKEVTSADEFLANKNYNKAITLYKQALENYDGDDLKYEAALFNKLGRAFEGLMNDAASKKEYNKMQLAARENFEKAVKFDPTNGEYYLTLGLHLMDWSYFEALPVLNKAIELNPNLAKAYLKRADIVFVTGSRNIDEATSKKILSSKDFSAAFNNINKALELDPHDAEAFRARAYYKHHKKEHLSAIEDLKKAVSLNPNYTEGYCLMGTCLNAIGKNEEACQNWEKAVALDNTHLDAVENLKKNKCAKL